MEDNFVYWNNIQDFLSEMSLPEYNCQRMEINYRQLQT